MRIPYASSSPPSPDGREEWLLDDAIDDTFPASDPVSHNQPGSILNIRYAARERRARASWPGDRTFWWLATGIVLAAVLLLRRRRPRDELR
jgi:hypothetical protein